MSSEKSKAVQKDEDKKEDIETRPDEKKEKDSDSHGSCCGVCGGE